MLTHSVETYPAHDCLAIPCVFDSKPCLDSKGVNGHGIGSATQVWLVSGAATPDGLRGVVQFKLYTQWFLPETYERMNLEVEGAVVLPKTLREPLPADLGYHSPYPMYESQTTMQDQGDVCDYLGVACYYDGSGLNAEYPWQILIKEGSKKLWVFLDRYWHNEFNR